VGGVGVTDAMRQVGRQGWVNIYTSPRFDNAAKAGKMGGIDCSTRRGYVITYKKLG
jgi:hypothetical protein